MEVTVFVCRFCRKFGRGVTLLRLPEKFGYGCRTCVDARGGPQAAAEELLETMILEEGRQLKHGGRSHD